MDNRALFVKPDVEVDMRVLRAMRQLANALQKAGYAYGSFAFFQNLCKEGYSYCNLHVKHETGHSSDITLYKTLGKKSARWG